MLTVPNSHGHDINAAFEDTLLSVRSSSDHSMCVQSATDLYWESLQVQIDYLEDPGIIDCLSNNYHYITVPEDFINLPLNVQQTVETAATNKSFENLNLMRTITNLQRCLLLHLLTSFLNLATFIII